MNMKIAKVYLLEHTHTHKHLEGGEDVKFLGVYSSQENAKAAQKKFATLPGFCDCLEGFGIGEADLDQACGWMEGYITVRYGTPKPPKTMDMPAWFVEERGTTHVPPKAKKKKKK
jgi:hypothetical protein